MYIYSRRGKSSGVSGPDLVPGVAVVAVCIKNMYMYIYICRYIYIYIYTYI